MTELTCEQCRENAAELAVGVLAGRERAATLAHLQYCGSCQGTVAELAFAANRFLELLPEIEPPAGFADRVVASITPASITSASASVLSASVSPLSDIPYPAPEAPAPREAAHQRMTRQRIPVAAAALAMVLLVVGGMAYTAGHTRGRSSSVPGSGPVVERTTDMISAPLILGQHQIGTAYLFAHRPVWIVVSISRADDPSTATLNDTVLCYLVRKDGSSISLGSFALSDGHADWATGTAIDPASLVGARLTAQVGHIISSASFTQPASGTSTSSPTTAAVKVPTAATPSTSAEAPATTTSKPDTKAPKDPKAPKAPKAPKTPKSGDVSHPTIRLPGHLLSR